MHIIQGILVALKGLTANKLRSSLTMLGIVIGVSAVISLMSIGKGAEAAITTRIEGLGANLLFVRPGAVTDGRVRSELGTRATLTLEDARAIADPDKVPAVALVAPQSRTFTQVLAGGQNTRTQVLGITPEYQEVRKSPVAEGEFISRADLTSRAKVAVLGSNVAQDLFEDSDPVGQRVRVGRYQMKVIGVLESKGGSGFGFSDDIVLVPLTTFQSGLNRQRTVRGEQVVQVINIQAIDQNSMEAAKEQISDLLRERHRLIGDDDFFITSQEDMIGAMQEITEMMTMFLGSIAAISLLVGGIGIMNIMLVSVTERIREIGIRKAVGAKRRDIMVQFLIEATTLSLSGGAIGVFVGWGASRLISGLSIGGQPFQTLVTPGVVLLAFSVAAAIGLFFGIYPASRAARLDPIEALRHE
ncbi:MAG: ABC transporter permease [Dehalococcoidia bacterium]